MPDPLKQTISATQAPALFDVRYIIDERGCWVWTGAKNTHGYGHLRVDGKWYQAHRLSYTLLVGAIPPRMELDHFCRNRACINPLHLEPVVTRTNLIRGNGWSGRNAQKTHCKRGHPFDEHNTYTPVRGGRYCRACAALKAKENRHARSS